ncbi:hypothetical protein BM86_32095 [Bacillus thuringiensis]|uniref:Uncharacterized protein n=1 Tax=Bacillus thuringiensis TaxID=1428 RepID=A0A9W3X4E9_BACTU|nr:hypothetical protein [Bacillus thuringiensis]ANS52277.1 hypothetical protein BT246_69860 [Bacillus thuringiensis]MBH0336612.1 hypothetical protein [Bacillus thuringiensis]MBH0339974.1 hypothetical protein [Bacillus thuringiensis]
MNEIITKETTMKHLMDEISQKINEKYTLRKIAKLSGVSREKITRAIECKNKYEMKLNSFLKVVSVLYDNLEVRRQKINTFILLGFCCKVFGAELNCRKNEIRSMIHGIF